jgi:uncharacterized protein (UPF0212 family)
MKANKDIVTSALDWIEDEEGCVLCPHCNANLQHELDCNELETFCDSGVSTIKDPYFCESSSATTVYWKCPKCGKPISEYISWDN